MKRFYGPNVAFIDWNDDFKNGAGNYLITFLPNKNYERTKKIVGVENDTLLQDRWEKEYYNCYGANVKIDNISRFNDQLIGIAGAGILTNDVAVKRVNRGVPAALDRMRFLDRALSGNFFCSVHPIDKRQFRQLKFKLRRTIAFRRHKMLVYHKGWRKNSAQMIELLESCGYKKGRDFDVVAWVNKKNKLSERLIVSRYNMIYSGSYSETGPANIQEFLHRGLVACGNEDWWDGYGFPQTVWTYDPTRREQMKNNLNYLLDPRNLFEIEALRDKVLSFHQERSDNEWSHFIYKLKIVIDNVLS